MLYTTQEHMLLFDCTIIVVFLIPMHTQILCVIVVCTHSYCEHYYSKDYFYSYSKMVFSRHAC